MIIHFWGSESYHYVFFEIPQTKLTLRACNDLICQTKSTIGYEVLLEPTLGQALRANFKVRMQCLLDLARLILDFGGCEAYCDFYNDLDRVEKDYQALCFSSWEEGLNWSLPLLS